MPPELAHYTHPLQLVIHIPQALGVPVSRKESLNYASAIAHGQKQGMFHCRTAYEVPVGPLDSSNFQELEIFF